MGHLTALGVREPSVELLKTSHRVREGYAGMIVATGFAVPRATSDNARKGEGGRAMEIQTRRHILEIWRATVEHSYRDGEWDGAAMSRRNSIMDAEQLLTILYPAIRGVDCVDWSTGSTRRRTTSSTTCARWATRLTSRAG